MRYKNPSLKRFYQAGKEKFQTNYNSALSLNMRQQLMDQLLNKLWMSSKNGG